MMKQELKKLLDAKINFLDRHTEWVANLVPVRKNNGYIRLCVDFHNLNRASKKDNYPIPPMEQILQKVAGSEMFSLLDGFSGYNQVLVSHSDQLLTAFRTKWGTYCDRKMSFGLINAGATFQRAMDIAFRGLINQSMVFYLDDVTIYSKKRSDHLFHLRQVLDRCRKYGISLNPKKSIFVVDKGKLLGFIVSRSGMTIEPEKIQSIENIPMPSNKKGMSSFLGKISFVKRFVPAFSEIVRPMQNMIKKNSVFKWNELEKDYFSRIKRLIVELPALLSPNFSKASYLYTFNSDLSYVVVLMQKNDSGDEIPIMFSSSTFKGVELKYPEVDKHAYAVFKAVKHFRPYLLKSKTHVIVPLPAVRNLLVLLSLSNFPSCIRKRLR